MESYFRIVFEGQKHFVRFPDGERINYITKTSIYQDTQQAISGIAYVDFEVCIGNLESVVSIDVNRRGIISPLGNFWPVEKIEAYSNDLDYARIGVFAVVSLNDCVFSAPKSY